MTEQQFSPLAARYMDTVFRVAYSYLRSPADADDVTQDVLIQLYKTDKAFSAADTFATCIRRFWSNPLANRSVTVPSAFSWAACSSGSDTT